MGTVALDEFDSDAAPTPSLGSFSVANASNVGVSNPLSYTPEPPPETPAGDLRPIIARLTTGFTRTLAEAPQMLGQGLYYLGSNMNPEATPEEQAQGNSFGDRIARLGVSLTERNQKYIAQTFPDSQPDDLWEKVGGAVPMVGSLAIGALTGFGEATAAAVVGGGAASAMASSFGALRARGKSTEDADALAAVIGAGSGSAMAFGMGNFLKATGAPLVQLAKGVINGFTGGALQTSVTGALELATGVQQYNGSDSLKALMAEAVKTGVTFGILGGPLGVHMALVQHRAVEKGFRDLGMEPKMARDAATATMSKGMDQGIKWLENQHKMTADEQRRISTQRINKPKLVDSTGTPRADILDEPFIPTEPNKTEALTFALEQQKADLKLIQKDIKSLQELLTANRVDQKTVEADVAQRATDNLKKLQDEAAALKESIEKLKKRLAPRVTPLQDVQAQIRRIKQGFRAGTKATEDEVKFVQKEFNNLIDQSDLSLNDKAKFRRILPKILSVEDFQKLLPEVLNKMKFLEDRAQQKTWREELLKFSAKNLPPDHKDILGQVLNEKKFTFTGTEPILNTKKLQDFFTNELGKGHDEGIVLSPGEQETLSNMAEKPWSQMTHEEKQNAVQVIKTIYTDGVNQSQLLSDFKTKNFDAFRTAFLKFHYGEEASDSKKAHEGQNEELKKKFWGKVAKAFSQYRESQVIPFYVYDRLGLGDLHQVLHEATADRMSRQLKVKAFLEGVFKDVGQGEMRKIFSEDVEEKVFKATGASLVRGDQLLDVYAHSFNDAGVKHLESNFPGKQIAEIRKYVEANYPEAARGIKKMFEYYDGVGYEETNAIHREMTGANMPKEDFYNPIRHLAHAAGKQLEMDLAMGAKGMMGRASTNDAFTFGRRNSALAFSRFDYFGNQISHLIDTMNYVSMAKVIRDANKIFYDPAISQAITDVAGKDILQMMRGHTRDLAFDGHKMDHEYDARFRALRFAFTVGKIGFNPMSAAKVFTQLSPAITYVGGDWVQGGLKDYLFDRKGYDSFIDEKSSFLKNRPFMQEREFIERFLRNGGNMMLTREEDFIKVGMWMHQEADRIVTRATWLGAYRKALAQQDLGGIADERGAVYAADLATALTHPTGTDLYLPPMFRGNEAMKWWTMFKKAINTNGNLLMAANRQFEGDKNLFSLAGKYMGYAVIPSFFLAWASLRRFPDKKELAEEILNNTTGTDIGMGYFTQALALHQRDVSATTPPTAMAGDLYHVATRKWDLDHAGTKVQDILSTVDDFRGWGLSNLYRDVTGKMFQPHKQEKQDDASGVQEFLHSGGI